MPETKPHPRNLTQILVGFLPADLAALDALAAERAEPGMRPNRSEVLRELVRAASTPVPRKKRKKYPVPR